MGTKLIVIVASIVALSAVVGGAAVAGTTTTVSCNFKLTDQSPPTAKSGADFGFVNCGKPFGAGVQTDTFKETFASKTSGSVTGPVKDYFDTGTVSGTYTLAVTVTGKTSATFKGTAKYTGGTGAFSHAAGSIALSCSSADGVHTACTGKGTLTGV
jgi:hypothetical protein